MGIEFGKVSCGRQVRARTFRKSGDVTVKPLVFGLGEVPRGMADGRAGPGIPAFLPSWTYHSKTVRQTVNQEIQLRLSGVPGGERTGTGRSSARIM
jgi:hypothetical protein